MPIGSAKIGVLGAGLVPGGSVTFNASGTFTVPPGVKKVNITGKGATGNPGNAGNAGNPGNPGTGGAGGGGGNSSPPGPGVDGARGGHAFRCPSTTSFRFPQSVIPSTSPNPTVTIGGRPPPSGCQYTNNAGGTGVSGNAGTAGTAGNSGTTGQASQGLNYNFAGGAGGNAGAGGAAGNGGTGGTGGGAGQPGGGGSAGGGGGNAGGSGGAGATQTPKCQWGPTINNQPPAFPKSCSAYCLAGGGGGGAGITNGGSGGVSNPWPAPIQSVRAPPCAGTQLIPTCWGFSGPPAPNNVRSQRASGGTFACGAWPGTTTWPSPAPYPAPSQLSLWAPPNTPVNTVGGLGGANQSRGVIGPGLYPVGNSFGGGAGGNPAIVLGVDYYGFSLAPGCAGINDGARPERQNISQFNPAPVRPQLFRAGGGGGGGWTRYKGVGCAVPPQSIDGGGGGGGGGRGNAGNAGGNSTGGAGVAATPQTFNCVPVTPGSPYPITVGSPGGQVVISWNPQ